MKPLLQAVFLFAFICAGVSWLPAQGTKKQLIPHGQSQPPGPALSPAEALKKMQVPPGFSVELVAAEPDLVNPVAMTFDEQGRIWVCESLEYPRRSAGPGKDRVKVLEDTDGDGKVDKVSIFADGLNIPSGIAVGHGGVWVANSPDILYYKLGPDLKPAGPPQVVVTGFGRADTHELPNSFTWGPDGWLYGLNGVFNPSVVKQGGREFRFTCALFRIHPRTKEFQVFCEGTSNPWGVAFDGAGSAFVSACVIDHLWHLVETGYYHRQGGPYPPYTWKIESIVKHKHQKAAYCGIHYFDSDAYPEEYRGKLYMGNIHGNCINCDELTRDGSTYFAKPRPDFLSANDAWFMPVVQRTGPDGCLYILDWYDRYHCYQDANRDPAGIDRLRGRLYRVRYKDTPRAPRFDLAKESDDELVARLHSPNIFYRDLAQRLLCERCIPDAAALRGEREPKMSPALSERRGKLARLLHDMSAPRRARMHALWALLGTGYIEIYLQDWLLHSKDATIRAWGVRGVADHRHGPARKGMLPRLARDPSPDVQLQVAIAARKLDGVDPLPVLIDVLAHCGHDRLIPHIVWQNLHPLLEERSSDYLQTISKLDLQQAANVANLMPRTIDRILASRKLAPDTLVSLLGLLSDPARGDRNACAQCLALLASKVHSGELAGAKLEDLRGRLQPSLRKLSAGPNATLAIDATLLAATLRDGEGLKAARTYLTEPKQPEVVRVKALAALVTAGADSVISDVAGLLAAKDGSAQFRGELLAVLGKLDQAMVADMVLGAYPKMEPELQPRAIELLTERAAWSRQLLGAIAKKKVPATALNVNQVRKLLATRDQALIKQVTSVWGTVREGRNPERETLVKEMDALLKTTPGDARAGAAIFKKVCAQCHKMYGEGVDVGPDITANGRSDYKQLLSNVFDPSLVIGAGYHATTVTTTNGQVLAGLIVEDSPQRVVLKVQGGKLETIARGDIDQVQTGGVSMMPEGLERQLQPRELADLFAYLCLDRPPDDPAARKIPGAPR